MFFRRCANAQQLHPAWVRPFLLLKKSWFSSFLIGLEGRPKLDVHYLLSLVTNTMDLWDNRGRASVFQVANKVSTISAAHFSPSLVGALKPSIILMMASYSISCVKFGWRNINVNNTNNDISFAKTIKSLSQCILPNCTLTWLLRPFLQSAAQCFLAAYLMQRLKRWINWTASAAKPSSLVDISVMTEPKSMKKFSA